MATGLRHPLRDLEVASAAVLARVHADADGVGPDLSLQVDPTFDRSPDDVPPPVGRVVVRIGDNRTSAGFERGLEAGCAGVMSVLQDGIVDSLGRPWPEVEAGGESVGVLDVALEPAGIAHWALRGEPICPVGQLVPTCHALGWRVRR